ncbi:DUF5412 domain-containing protein [Priestia megaterium]|uniref:DUF5412 domain-containing protein n=1 Tax=Priestia megaterium TaxID=1404 RepID=UPI0021BFF3B8|nr:DUF5412 domain-containing protein [Priestia megaterium]MCT9853009.1 DUF5412 domain-containing protein [Priestia megaterium]MDF1963005.1 DUF5412 domain-containing protein [Priestia megaterium]
MKKVYMIILGALVSVFIIVFTIWQLFFNPQHLPSGDYISQSTSPDGNYTVKIYQSSGGATTGFAIRGEVIYNNKSFNKTKNIYWNYPQEKAKVKWINHDTVNISGHVLNVKKDTFDFRNDTE